MRFTNKVLNEKLRDLRNNLRNGGIIVSYKKEGLYFLVKAYLGEALTIDNFNPQTLRRFNVLFEVPNLGSEADGDIWPTQDDTAIAIQNFINRRSDPWREFKLKWANENQVDFENEVITANVSSGD